MPDILAPPLLLDVTPTVGLKGGKTYRKCEAWNKMSTSSSWRPWEARKEQMRYTCSTQSLRVHHVQILSFQSSCWPSCCISYAIWKVLRFSACKKEHNASNIPLKLGHANLGSTYSPLQRYEFFMKLPTFSCYFFIIYIHFFFESFVFLRKSDYLCHRNQLMTEVIWIHLHSL